MSDDLNVSIYREIQQEGMTEPDIAVHHTPTYGQCAEDIIVCAALRALAFDEHIDLASEAYLEIGANHPVATSATWLLHKHLGMRGILIEANPHLIDELRRHRPHDTILHAAVIANDSSAIPIFISSKNELSSTNRDFVTQWPGEPIELQETTIVPGIRINAVITEHMAAKAPLFLSIDVEGEDFSILQDLDFSLFRPAIIQVEPSDHFHENNSREISEFLQGNSYNLIGRTDVNLIFSDALRAPAMKKLSAELQSQQAALEQAEQKNQRILNRFSELNARFLAQS